MTRKTLTAIDLVGIQRFIFSSNRLKDVTGASHLVNLAASRDVDRPGGGSRKVGEAVQRTGAGALRDCDAAGAAIVGGGGNAILEFEDGERARELSARYSRWLIENAPGLEAVIAHEEYDTGFAGALDRLLKKTAKAKFTRAPSVPLLGLGVTAACRETGLPADAMLSEREPTARSIALIRAAEEEARTYWRQLLLSDRTLDGAGPAAFPRELDDLGRSEGDTSLIAVVHIDGNGVGRKIMAWLEGATEKNDADVRTEYVQWSGDIDALGRRVMKAVVDRVAGAVTSTPALNRPTWTLNGRPDELSFELAVSKQGEVYLPLRPVILGGDDITFICDGRVALDLATTALEELERGKHIRHLGEIGACAGVAIVHSHAPILRAWNLAEQLCRSAKRRVKETGRAGFALDWHIGLPRPGQTLADVREEQYRTPENRLTCRPYIVGDVASTDTWKWLESSLLDVKAASSLRGPVWSERRNKVKQLAPLSRAGCAEVENTLSAWRVVDDQLALPGGMSEGFIGNKTPLLDASELLDVHLSLRKEASQ